MSIFNKELLKNLIKERKKKDKNFTQEKLAKTLGVSRGHISLIIKGKREPSMKLIKKMADYFGISSSDFIKDPSKNNTKTLEDIAQQIVNFYLKKIGQEASEERKRKMCKFVLYKLKQSEKDIEKMIELLID